MAEVPKMLPARLALGLGMIDETAYKRARAVHKQHRDLDSGVILLEQDALTHDQLELIRRLLGMSKKRPDRKLLLRQLGAHDDGDTGIVERLEILRASPWQPGKVVLNRYQVVRPLGHGAMGDVVQAFDRFLGRQVAIKAPHVHLATNPAAMQALRDEVALAHAVNHPNVARTFDLGEVDGLPYVSMELIEGRTLKDELGKDGKLDEAGVRRVGRRLCAALDAAHRAGVVHRDLKPANVMLVDGPRQVVVMDFGIAALATHGESQEPPDDQPANASGPMSGTPAYMAPEQWSGRPPEPRTDIYQLGVLLYRMAAGRLPYEGRQALELCRQHTVDPVPPLREHAPDISADLAALIERCLAKDPAERPSSMAEVGDALRTPNRVRLVASTVASSVAAAVVLLLVGQLLISVARNAILGGLRPATARLAQLSIEPIDPADLAAVARSKDMDAPAFRRVHAHLQRVKQANPEVKFIYTLRKLRQGDMWSFVVDANPRDEDKDGDGKISDEEEGSPPGLEYEYTRADFPMMFESLEQGVPRADLDFNTDQWGFLLSGYATIDHVGQDGARQRFLLGVDVGNQPIQRFKSWVVGLFSLLWLALTLLSFRFWITQLRAGEGR